MSRVPKNNINTPFLHIMIQGNNKSFIFENTKDKEKYLNILHETKEEIPTTILAYCIMGNHVHLLFYDVNIDNIIKFMHKTNLLYAKYYNYNYDRVGYVFRDRYKTQPIMSEKHLITCIDYIHQNPVKAGICLDASEYLYSSFNKNIFAKTSKIELDIKKYIESLKQLYKNEKYNDFVLLEDDKDSNDKENLANSLIGKYLEQKNIEIEELIKNDEIIAKISKRFKEKYNISYRVTSKVLGISREKLRMIMKRIN